MKRFVSGESRSQATLFPELLDDFVSEDNSFRAIEAFVEALDLRQLGFKGVDPQATGRPVPRCTPEILSLRIPKSCPIQPPTGARGAAQY